MRERRGCGEMGWLAMLLLALAALPAQAGVLLLGNGDRISGDLIGVGNGHVSWRSDLFGDIQVPQVNVRLIDSRGLFEVALDAERHLDGCQIQSIPGRQLLNCEQGIVDLASWRLVQSMSVLPLLRREPWRTDGSVSVAGSNKSGNTDEVSLNVDAMLEVRRGAFRHTLGAEYDRKNSAEARIEDMSRYTYQYDYFFSDRWYYNGTLGTERNRFADVSHRNHVGGGLGHQFFDTEFVRLSVELGPSYVWEEFITDVDREALFLRAATRFSWRLTRSGIEFFHRNSLLQSLDQGEDWEIESDTGFKLPIYGGLNAQLQLEYDYDNLPSNDAVPEDRVWSLGLGYDW